MLTIKLTDGEAEMVLRALHLQVETWTYADKALPESLRSEQRKSWGALHDKVEKAIEESE